MSNSKPAPARAYVHVRAQHTRTQALGVFRASPDKIFSMKLGATAKLFLPGVDINARKDEITTQPINKSSLIKIFVPALGNVFSFKKRVCTTGKLDETRGNRGLERRGKLYEN